MTAGKIKYTYVIWMFKIAFFFIHSSYNLNTFLITGAQVKRVFYGPFRRRVAIVTAYLYHQFVFHYDNNVVV